MNCNHATNLRMSNIYMMLVSLTLFVAALFVTAILPSLLLRYVYAGQQLLAEPKALEYIPLVSFAIATLYFIYALIATTLSEIKIRRIINHDCYPQADEAELTDSELTELEAMVDAAIAEKSNNTKTKRSSSKTKRTSKPKAKKSTRKRKTA